jgi:hypothetical protein
MIPSASENRSRAILARTLLTLEAAVETPSSQLFLWSEGRLMLFLPSLHFISLLINLHETYINANFTSEGKARLSTAYYTCSHH